MASPTLAITLTTNSTCTDITVTDSTTDYGTGSNITVNSVTSLVMVVNLSGGNYLTFTFTIVTGTITAATLGLSGATPTSILSSLASTTFPLSAFSIWRDYSVTVPTFGDGVVEVDYTIAGTDPNTGTPYNYTTSAAKLVMCEVCCCIQKLGQAIDPSCDCSDASIMSFLRADTYLQIAKFATQVGNIDRAQLALDKATELCDCGCTDCN